MKFIMYNFFLCSLDYVNNIYFLSYYGAFSLNNSKKEIIFKFFFLDSLNFINALRLESAFTEAVLTKFERCKNVNFLK
jgi:hypothetical protein